MSEGVIFERVHRRRQCQWGRHAVVSFRGLASRLSGAGAHLHHVQLSSVLQPARVELASFDQIVYEVNDCCDMHISVIAPGLTFPGCLCTFAAVHESLSGPQLHGHGLFLSLACSGSSTRAIDSAWENVEFIKVML